MTSSFHLFSCDSYGFRQGDGQVHLEKVLSSVLILSPTSHFPLGEPLLYPCHL